MKMSNSEIVSNKMSGILEPDHPYSFELELAGGIVKVKLNFEPGEADKMLEIEGLSRPRKISFICSFKDVSVSKDKRKE